MEKAITPVIEHHPWGFFLPENTHLLMLGSFPPPRIRWSMDFYYPNIQNDMWRILGLLFYADKDYFLATPKNFSEEKCRAFCNQIGLGLGDTGMEIIRQKGNLSPVIMLTAKSEIDDRITGLDAGADDYLMKPFSVGELLARIRSLTRRNTQFSPLTLSAGSVHLNIEEQNLSCKNSIRLNHKETKLMKLFMTNMDKSLSTNHIFSAIWADEIDADENIVWIYISYLREKLEAINADIQILGQKGLDFLLTQK